VLKVQKALNRDTGVESSKQLSFGEASWGHATQQYLCSVDNLRRGRFDKIMAMAKLYMKSATQKGSRGDHDDADDNCEDDNDERGHLVDLSSDQGEFDVY
jgi:hypothetical protein